MDFRRVGSVEMGLAEFGQFIVQRRQRLGMLQKELAAKADLNQSTVSRLERGTGAQFPSPEELHRLAVALECTEDDLLRAAGYVAQNEPAPVLTMSEDDVPWERLPPHVRRMVRGMIDAYFAEEENNKPA